MSAQRRSLERAGHDAGRDRSGAARAAGRASTPKTASYIPARVLNMIAFVDDEWSGEIANRLRGVGRYHASRLVVLSYEPDAHAPRRARDASPPKTIPSRGELALLHETVVVELGDGTSTTC